MKQIIALLLSLSFISVRAQTDGEIDPSFGTNGRVSTSLPGETVDATQQKIVVLSNGKILQAFAVGGNFGIVRYNNTDDAPPDATFGTAGTGVQTIDFGGVDGATTMIVQADGKIILGGFSGNNFAIARLTSDGALDVSFSGDGKLTTAFGSSTAAIYSVNLQGDGKIIAAGNSFDGTVSTFALARYNTDGTPDATFDTDGMLTTSFNGINDLAFATVIQPDGKIVVAGYIQTSGGSAFALARYNTNGSLDTGFDTDGKLSTTFGANAEAYAVTLQPDGKIIAAGYGSGASTLDFALARYNVNGSLDVNFDADGKVLTPVGTAADKAYAIGVQNDGRIVAVGTSFSVPGMGDDDFAIVRYTTAGVPDVTFSTDGKNTIDFGTADDQAFSFGSQGMNLIIGGTTGTSLALTRITNSSFILPLYLYSFTATKQNGTVVLNWKTFNEQHTAMFEVQRSLDGVKFSKIGSVAGAGTSVEERNYTITDGKPATGSNFYRLKMIDTDGKFTYSKIVVVRTEGSTVTLQAFPNPMQHTLNLQFNAPAGKVKILLTDAIGRLVQTVEVTSNGSTVYTSLDVSKLKTGLYFVSVNGASMKLIKE